jgi:hypothetical protein
MSLPRPHHFFVGLQEQLLDGFEQEIVKQRLEAGEGAALRPGAYTRPLFSSTYALSVR